MILVTGWAGATSAHHGITGQFDTTQTVELTGVVTDMRFVNPHSYVYFDVETDAGDVLPWRCEMRAATALRRSGWTPELFTPGTEIAIVGSPDRRDAQTCYLITVTFDNGTTLERYEQRREIDDVERAPRLANGRPNLGGDWAAPQLLLFGESARGLQGLRTPTSSVVTGIAPPREGGADAVQFGGVPEGVELTPAGIRAAEGFDVQRDNPRQNCLPTNIFLNWTADFHVNRIIQDDASIILRYGFMDLDRTIYLGMAEHPQNITPSREGHSIGSWEDDVLIVDTIGFAPGVLITRRDLSLMHSDQMHTVERFSYDVEKQSLLRTYVAEDPLYFTGQFTGQDTLYLSDVPFDTIACTDLKDDAIQTIAAEPARIAVYGASGRVGSRIVAEALSRGHYVTGIGRRPESITLKHERLSIATGDIRDSADVARLVKGHDAVISAVGGANPDSDDPLDSVPRQGAEALVTALRSLGDEAPRMMVVGGGSTTLDESPGVPFVDPDDIPEGPRGTQMIGHRLALEYLRMIEDVRWTFVAPALQMRPGERTGTFRVGPGIVIRDTEDQSVISMEDLAVAMIDEIEDPQYIRARFTAAY